MIFCNLSTILGKKRLKLSTVINETGISRPTLTSLFYNTGKGINYDTLNSLCHYLRCNIEDLLYYVDLDIVDLKISYILDSVKTAQFETPNGPIEANIYLEYTGEIRFKQNLPPLQLKGALTRTPLGDFSCTINISAEKIDAYYLSDDYVLNFMLENIHLHIKAAYQNTFKRDLGLKLEEYTITPL